MKKYSPLEMEPKWQKKWKDEEIYKVNLDEASKKFYLLVEFTYPSGDLHIGHWFTFAVPDILARFKRMQGFSVLFPNGFDAFGLPAENAAIKNGIHPRDWTLKNIETMKQQFKLMGAIHNWEHSVITCDADYYRWNQWIFLKMLEKGVAYKGKSLANWCPNCQTVLANENVEAGKCWRCGTEVEQKEIEQWFLKITEYADKLIWDQGGNGVDWPKPTMEGQNNWIGKSSGTLLKFEPFESKKDPIEVFTTRIDTIFGATFLAISPEHPLLNSYVTEEQAAAVEAYVALANKKSELERKENKDKTGVFTGSFAVNPLNNEKIPVWVADYVLMGYGTGAIMAVPAHDERDFEFAKKFNLEIKEVVKGGESLPFEGEGELINSEKYSGLTSSQARENLSKYIEEHQFGEIKVQYHLHDWSISRQRYWGTPIPIINCAECGPVPVPFQDLPVELPYEVDYAPKGKPPLATAIDWINVKCPKCGGDAKREAETMDTFVDSSWYFLRYLDPKNDTEIASMKYLEDWLPIDIYFGGSEHTLGHTLYSRFFYKFLIDIKAIPDSSGLGEYAKKRYNHGVILGPDGSRMSKSRGNVINPDEQVKEYGADAVRMYLAFIGPYDIVAPWNPTGINGIYNFLQRVWNLQEKVTGNGEQVTGEDLRIMHKTIKKVTEDIEGIKFNTAISALMEWLNYLIKKDQRSKIKDQEYKTFLLLLAPFAPHITEELWSSFAKATEDKHWSVHQQSWPEFDNKYLEKDEVLIVVQIDGKVRERLLIQKAILSNKEAIEDLAFASLKVKSFIKDKKSVKKSVYIEGKILSLSLAK